MPVITVRLFGQISVQYGAQSLTTLPAKALELLCYLLVYRDRSHTRNFLAEMLWPNASCKASSKYLRQTLWQLQMAMDPGVLKDETPTDEIILLNPGWVQINPHANCWVDANVLEEAYDACRDLPGQQLTADTAKVLTDAIDLYQGELLDTWYQDWCLFERERLQLIYLAMLDKLMEYCEAHALYERGVAYGHTILRYDPARECTYRQLMRLRYLAGDRTSALREYERCVAALEQELQLTPTQLTMALYEQIRADDRNGLHEQAVNPPLSPNPPHPAQPTPLPPRFLDELSQQLTQLQMNLATFQSQVRAELADILQLLENQQKTPRQTRQ